MNTTLTRRPKDAHDNAGMTPGFYSAVSMVYAARITLENSEDNNTDSLLFSARTLRVAEERLNSVVSEINETPFGDNGTDGLLYDAAGIVYVVSTALGCDESFGQGSEVFHASRLLDCAYTALMDFAEQLESSRVKTFSRPLQLG